MANTINNLVQYDLVGDQFVTLNRQPAIQESLVSDSCTHEELTVALRALHFQVIEMTEVNSLVLNLRPLRLIISNGDFHVAVRRFIPGGPIYVFNAHLNQPVEVGSSWLEEIGELRDLKCVRFMGRINDEEPGRESVKARKKFPIENLLLFYPLVPPAVTGLYYFERQVVNKYYKIEFLTHSNTHFTIIFKSNHCGKHSINNAMQFELFTAEELNRLDVGIVNRRLNQNNDQIGGDWTNALLCEALETRGFTLDPVTGPILEQLSISRQPVRVILSTGVHHIAVCRFVDRGPLLVFNSQLDAPVEVPPEWWLTIRQENTISIAAERIVGYPLNWQEPLGLGTVASRLSEPNEELFHMAAFVRDPLYFGRFDVNLFNSIYFLIFNENRFVIQNRSAQLWPTLTTSELPRL